MRSWTHRFSQLLTVLAGLLASRRRSALVPVPVSVIGQRPPSERGASVVEYALLIGLIAVVCFGAVTFFGSEVGNSMSTSGTSIAN